MSWEAGSSATFWLRALRNHYPGPGDEEVEDLVRHIGLARILGIEDDAPVGSRAAE